MLDQLMDLLHTHTTEGRRGQGGVGILRIGVSGAPGVGKSCFIEALGLRLVEAGHRVAVLAVDPASPSTRGSLLADRTRMARLQAHPRAFVRPSSSAGELGGARRTTAETISIVEAAAFDRVIVESVGVGQSEVHVAHVTDAMLLLLPPVGGDHWQAAKKGIMEAADLLVVNKADGELSAAAQNTAAELEVAVHSIRPRWRAARQQVLTCSSITGHNIDKVVEWLGTFHMAVSGSGELLAHRKQQIDGELFAQVQFKLTQALRSSGGALEEMQRQHARICAGEVSSRKAADAVLEAFWREMRAKARASRHSHDRANDSATQGLETDDVTM